MSNDRGVILTTHAMEEADAVCGRIAIVTKGKMQCIGSGQHLKNKFGTGYVITLLVKESRDANEAKTSSPTSTEQEEGRTEVEFFEVSRQWSELQLEVTDRRMAQLFGTTCKRGEVQGLSVEYRCPTLDLGSAFTTLATVLSSELNLASYSVNQVTSLEQVFLDIAGQVGEL